MDINIQASTNLLSTYICVCACLFNLPTTYLTHSSMEATDHTYFSVIMTPQRGDWWPVHESKNQLKDIFSRI